MNAIAGVVLLSRAEAAAHLGVSVSTLGRMSGFVRVGNRRNLRYTRESVEKVAATVASAAVPGFDWLADQLGEEPVVPSVGAGSAGAMNSNNTMNDNRQQTNNINITTGANADETKAAVKDALDEHWSGIADNHGIRR